MSLLIPTQLFSKTFVSLVHDSRKSSKRGVSEIIGSMILLGVTVSGGLLVFTLLQSSDIVDIAIEDPSIDPNVIAKLKLIGYDTRDAEDLYEITDLNNQIGTSTSAADHLCTTCTTTNEFIILKIRNDAATIIDIRSINVNEEEHTFDDDHTVSNQSFVAPSGETPTVPESGEYIIISGSNGNIKQEPASTIPEGATKRIVIRLSSDITPNDVDDDGLALNSKIRVVINSSVETTQLLLVPAGRIA